MLAAAALVSSKLHARVVYAVEARPLLTAALAQITGSWMPESQAVPEMGQALVDGLQDKLQHRLLTFRAEM